MATYDRVASYVDSIYNGAVNGYQQPVVAQARPPAAKHGFVTGIRPTGRRLWALEFQAAEAPGHLPNWVPAGGTTTLPGRG